MEADMTCGYMYKLLAFLTSLLTKYIVDKEFG